MPRLTNPTLPDRVIDVSDDLAAVLAKSGWVAETGADSPSTEPLIVQLIVANEPNLFRSSAADDPTDAPDDDTSVEDDPTDPALAGNL